MLRIWILCRRYVGRKMRKLSCTSWVAGQHNVTEQESIWTLRSRYGECKWKDTGNSWIFSFFLFLSYIYAFFFTQKEKEKERTPFRMKFYFWSDSSLFNWILDLQYISQALRLHSNNRTCKIWSTTETSNH